MSLKPDDERGGKSGRSRSRTRERSRSRDARAPSPNPKGSSSSKSKDTRKARFADEPSEETKATSAANEPAPTPRYEERKPPTVIPGLSSLSLSRNAFAADEEDSDDESQPDTGEPSYKPSQPPVDVRSSRGIEMPSFPDVEEPEPAPPKEQNPRQSRNSLPYPAYGSGMYPDDENNSYTMMPAADYAITEPFKYAPPPEKVSYSAKPIYAQPPVPHTTLPPTPYPHRQFSTSSIPTTHSRDSQQPSSPVRSSSYSSYTPLPRDTKSRDTKAQDATDSKRKSSRVSTMQPQLEVREPSSGLAPRMDRLSVSGNRPDVSGHGVPPASPLLEAYHGTYQSMPSPMMLPSESGLDAVPPLSPLDDNDISSKKVAIAEPKSQKKRVKIYDAEGDAETLASALGHTPARPGPLIDVLPELTHDQLLKLRDEYKKRVKVQGRGVNIAKHIKMKTSGNFGKICYVTALGRWESEAYWANFWYQSRSSSRELLIEALMGRSNAEIREIKDSFRDKRYDDSLYRCMEKELKPDKFRTAILMALEAKRQEETDPWPTEYKNQDREVLYNALNSREGGETAILQIVVRRSDNHLRDVLRTYERLHQQNFAREALRKSNNLVGEVIAHILNGCINRAARDSLLLRHAIEDISTKNRAVELRYELLMSRLIRLHWDRSHLTNVKNEYKKKYQTDIETDIDEATKGEFGEFCLRLCEI